MKQTEAGMGEIEKSRASDVSASAALGNQSKASPEGAKHEN
jgi:hypothetical protein